MPGAMAAWAKSTGGDVALLELGEGLRKLRAQGGEEVAAGGCQGIGRAAPAGAVTSPPTAERHPNSLARVRCPVFVARKQVLAMRAHPRPDAELRVTVAGRGVDVVHPVFEQEFEDTVRLALAHVLERRGAEIWSPCSCARSGRTAASRSFAVSFAGTAAAGRRCTWRGFGAGAGAGRRDGGGGACRPPPVTAARRYGSR